MVGFELSVIVATLLLIGLLYCHDKAVLKKFTATFIGVLLFEYFTQALWLNKNLARWAYLYLDVSWIITLGWTGIILGSQAIIESRYAKIKEWKRFLLTLGLVTVIGVLAEGLVRYLGIREYSSAVQQVLSGYWIAGLVPLEALYYIPVFMALVLSFSKYWQINLRQPIKAVKAR